MSLCLGCDCVSFGVNRGYSDISTGLCFCYSCWWSCWCRPNNRSWWNQHGRRDCFLECCWFNPGCAGWCGL